MAATPQYCQFTFVSGNQTIMVDGYISDVNAAYVNFDGGGGAGTTSPTEWVAPVNCTLVDFSMVTGTADTEKIRLVRGASPSASILRYVPHLTTNSSRPKLNWPISKGERFRAIQISD